MALSYAEFLEKLQNKLPEEVDGVKTVRLFPIGYELNFDKIREQEKAFEGKAKKKGPRSRSRFIPESIRVSVEISGMNMDMSFDGKDLYEAYLKRKRDGHEQPFKGVIKGLRREVRLFKEAECERNEEWEQSNEDMERE